MKYSRQVVALSVAAFVIGLAACDNGSQSVTPNAPQQPAASLSEASSKLVLKPKRLSFSSTGTSKTVTVKDKGYTGKIKAAAASCKGIASASPSRGKGPSYKVKIAARGGGTCFIVFSDSHKNKATLTIDVSGTTPSPSSSPSTSPSNSPSGSPSTSPSSSASPSPTGSPTLGPVVATPAAATICPSSGAAACSSDTQTIALSQAHYSGTFTHSTSCNSTTQATVVAQTGSTYLISAKTTPGTCTATFIGSGGKFATVPVTIVGAVVASPNPAYVCPSGGSCTDSQVVTLSESNYSGNFTENDTCSGIATVVQDTLNTYTVTGGSTDNQSCTATFTGILGEHVVISIQVNSGIGVH